MSLYCIAFYKTGLESNVVLSTIFTRRKRSCSCFYDDHQSAVYNDWRPTKPDALNAEFMANSSTWQATAVWRCAHS